MNEPQPIPTTAELVNRLWNGMPKVEQDDISHESFAEGVKQARLEFLDLMVDFYDEGFDAGFEFDPTSEVGPEAFKKLQRQLFTASLPPE